MSRWKAALIHLGISCIVALIALALLLGLWYPPPYFNIAGGDRLVFIMVGVDLILGPLLTLIVFRAGKKGLKLDLAIIGLLQIAALLYGMSVVLQTRPVFIVSAIDRFVVVTADQLEPKDLADAPLPEFRQLSWTGPRMAAAARPPDQSARSDLLFSGLAGKDLERFPKFYVPYADEAHNLLTRAQPLTRLHPDHAATSEIIATWLRENKRATDSVVWLPLVARRGDMTMLLDASNGMPLGAIPVDPW